MGRRSKNKVGITKVDSQERNFTQLLENSITQNYGIHIAQQSRDDYTDYFNKVDRGIIAQLNEAHLSPLSPTIQTKKANKLKENVIRIGEALHAEKITHHITNVTIETAYYTHNDVVKLRKYTNKLLSYAKIRLNQINKRKKALALGYMNEWQYTIGSIDATYFESVESIPLAKPRYRFVIEWIILTNTKVNPEKIKGVLLFELSRKSEKIKKEIELDSPKYAFALYAQTLDTFAPRDTEDKRHTVLDIMNRNNGYFVEPNVFKELNPERHVHRVAFSNIYTALARMKRYHETGICDTVSSPLKRANK